MKQTIKVRRLNKNLSLPTIIDKGEWIDLKLSSAATFEAPKVVTVKDAETGKTSKDVVFDTTMLPLGIAMKLPKGYEAIVAPRSSTFKYFGLIERNSIGVIDNSYSGNTDEWMFPAIAFRKSSIPEGERICQFRIQLSQKATIWQKIKWLLSSGIRIVEVDTLDGTNRGGFGSTGTR